MLLVPRCASPPLAMVAAAMTDCLLAAAAHLQTTLRANVEGARAVVALARRCSRLRAVVHTSSAYVNINQPVGSTVQERLYPLMHGGWERTAEELVQVSGRGRQAMCVRRRAAASKQVTHCSRGVGVTQSAAGMTDALATAPAC
jgi:nucleoside-diphosphate-sugar epimerase